MFELLFKVFLRFLHQAPELFQDIDRSLIMGLVPVFLEGLDLQNQAVQNPLRPRQIVVAKLLRKLPVCIKGCPAHCAESGPQKLP